MNTEFQQNIQSWVQIDNLVKKASTNLSQLRERRNNLQDNITSYVEENNLDNDNQVEN